MSDKLFASLSEQVAEKLRDGMRKGIWKQEMPGRYVLARELGVNHKTVESALGLLEKEGLLLRQGPGKGRKIVQLRENSSRSLSLPMKRQTGRAVIWFNSSIGCRRPGTWRNLPRKPCKASAWSRNAWPALSIKPMPTPGIFRDRLQHKFSGADRAARAATGTTSA